MTKSEKAQILFDAAAILHDILHDDISRRIIPSALATTAVIGFLTFIAEKMRREVREENRREVYDAW